MSGESENVPGPDPALDFEARRLLRRRIFETLEAHQKREAETVVRCADELVNHLSACLQIFGRYLAGASDAQRPCPYFARLCEEDYALFLMRCEEVRRAESEVQEHSHRVEVACGAVKQIEPSWIKQMMPAPEKREPLKLARQALEYAERGLAHAQSALTAGECGLRVQTRRVLERAAREAEQSLEDAPWSEEVRRISTLQVGRARERWSEHLREERDGLSQIIESAYALSRTGGMVEPTN